MWVRTRVSTGRDPARPNKRPGFDRDLRAATGRAASVVIHRRELAVDRRTLELWEQWRQRVVHQAQVLSFGLATLGRVHPNHSRLHGCKG